jgi:hypothetical protein
MNRLVIDSIVQPAVQATPLNPFGSLPKKSSQSVPI